MSEHRHTAQVEELIALARATEVQHPDRADEVRLEEAVASFVEDLRYTPRSTDDEEHPEVQVIGMVREIAAARLSTEADRAGRRPRAAGLTPRRMIGPALHFASAAHARRIAGHDVVRAGVEPGGYLDGPEHLIYGGRQEGKTEAALRWVTEAPDGVRRVLVTLTEELARDHLTRLGLPRSDTRVIGWRHLHSRGPEDGVEYGIDETAELLTRLLKLDEQPRLLTVCLAAPWQGSISA